MDEQMSSEDTTDIRFEAPKDMAAVFAAIAKGRRMTRNELVLRLMHELVDEHVRMHSVLDDAAARNPIVSEKLGKGRQ